MKTAWWDFVDELRGDLSDRQFAAKVGVTQPTVGRWRRGHRPDTDLIIQVARSCGVSVVEALVAGEVLDAQEVAAYRSGSVSLSTLPTAALIDELQFRLEDWKLLDESHSVDRVVSKRISKGFRQ